MTHRVFKGRTEGVHVVTSESDEFVLAMMAGYEEQEEVILRWLLSHDCPGSGAGIV